MPKLSVLKPQEVVLRLEAVSASSRSGSAGLTGSSVIRTAAERRCRSIRGGTSPQYCCERLPATLECPPRTLSLRVHSGQTSRCT